MRAPIRQSGFTLLEAIIAIVITGIIGAMVAVFIARPVQGYIDSVRRAALTDVADLALKRMGIELRTAVPNSVRVDASGRYVEFIPARFGGRYCADVNPGCDALTFNGTDAVFRVLGPAHDAAANESLIVYNTGQTGLNAYAGDTRRTIASSGTTTTDIAFSGSGYTLPSPTNRFQVVPTSGPVSFGCDTVGGVTTGTGTLRRYDSYGYKVAQATTGLGTGALLAGQLAECQFTYDAISARNGLVTLRLRLLAETESVTLVHQIHVDNQP